jgi:hypothetical protein
MVYNLRRLPACLTLLVLILLPLSSVTASGMPQVAAETLATLSQPIIKGFPRITAYLDVRNKDGGFLHGLQASQITILEDDRPRPVLEFNETQPGVQFVVALNPGKSFSIRDSNGKSRYDSLRQTIQEWASQQANPSDNDLSLVITDGPQTTHQSDPQQLTVGLQSYQPDNVPENPDLNTLSSAVETVSDTTPRPGMGRAILFITSLPSIDLTVGLQSLAGAANQEGVHISIWLVASPDQAGTPAAVQLQDLANRTRGQFFLYSGSEALPSIDTLIQSMQDSYNLAYDSRINSAVPHKISAQIDLAGQIITTSMQTFELNIQAPNPMFVSPPTQIQRETPQDSRNPKIDLLPVQQPLDVLIEFPDGFSRSIVTSTLYIDGAAAEVNQSAPFDKFNWDLSGYTSDSDHRLQVVVVDALGLRGASIDLPVHIVVRRTTQSVMMLLYRNGPLLAGLAVLLAGAVLLMVLILGGRIKPKTFGRGTQPGVKVRPAEKTVPHRRSDPVTQPVPNVHSEPAIRRKPAWMNRLQWPQRRISPKAFAFLSRLSEADQEEDATPVPLEGEEVTLGRDPIRSNVVIDDLSVEPLHACLRREGDTYRLSDQGSVAGTWVNYAPVSNEGVLLEHTDLIHIGRVGFRFSLGQPGHVRKPVARPEETKP